MIKMISALTVALGLSVTPALACPLHENAAVDTNKVTASLQSKTTVKPDVAMSTFDPANTSLFEKTTEEKTPKPVEVSE